MCHGSRLMMRFLNVAYTQSGEKCMTECTSNQSGKLYCLTGWRRGNFCENTEAVATKFYASNKKQHGYECTSECKKAGNNYNWCFTSNDDSSWDYCSPYAGVTYKEEKCLGPCTMSLSDGYTCQTSRNSRDICSPSPTESLKRNLQSHRKCQPIHKKAAKSELRKRGTNDNNLSYNFHRFYYDIWELVRRSESTNRNYTLHQDNGPDVIISSSEHNGVEVVHSMRARLTRDNIPATGSGRVGGHPGGYQNRMRQLDQQRQDEVGHMLALSLGGPNDLINLAPQHAITNRNLHKTDDAYSFWRRTEAGIRSFALDYYVTHVDWTLYIFYEGDLNIAANRRPIGFGFRYIVHYRNGDTMDSSDCTFNNDYDE
jgi:hypothetical protein